MKALSDIGLQLSITGGITPADLPLFKDIQVKAFIAGRALAEHRNRRRSLRRSMRRSMLSGEISMRNHPLGIYEALAKDLQLAGAAGAGKKLRFDFVEMSVDETDERLSRLDWSPAQRASLVTAMLETGWRSRRCASLPIAVSVWQPRCGRA